MRSHRLEPQHPPISPCVAHRDQALTTTQWPPTRTAAARRSNVEKSQMFARRLQMGCTWPVASSTPPSLRNEA